MLRSHPERGTSPGQKRELQRMKQLQEKMRARCQAELEATITHLQSFARQAEIVDIGLLELNFQMEDALSTLLEGTEPLNSPAYHIQLLRQLRKHYPLLDEHDSAPHTEAGLSQGCSEDGSSPGSAQATSECIDEAPEEQGVTGLQRGEAALDDARHLGKLVELDRYRDQVKEGIAEPRFGGVEATGSHCLHEVAPAPTRRQHCVDKKGEVFQTTATDGTSDGEYDGAYVQTLGFVAGHLPDLERKTVEFFASMIRSELYDLPGCS